MSLGPGTRLGAYEIIALIGAGGMGEVYRARDTRLKRDVAIKILPAELSRDNERRQRFEQEARAAAALTHPNILAVFDIGDVPNPKGLVPESQSVETVLFIVSELLEGQTLRDKLNDAAIPSRKVIDYAIQIARALAAAHGKGIVHRDLKPENVFLTSDGRAKILDFGLAKLVQPDGNAAVTDPADRAVSADAATAMPTRPAQTQHGVVLGTVGYMAPEQVRGRAADHRADIFAFGAVLYEMVARRRAFSGDTPADTTTAILTGEPPDLETLSNHTPPALARIVERCLEKDPARRFQSSDDLAFAVEALATTSGAASATTAPPPWRLRRIATIAAVALSGLAGAAATLMFVSTRQTRPAVVRMTIGYDAPLAPGLGTFGAISPDGRRFAYVGIDDQKRLLIALRSLDRLEPQFLAGTDGAILPFWSPDGTSIGFFSRGKLNRIDATGGPVVRMADAVGAQGGSWNREGTIIFAASGLPIMRVAASGGAPTPATTLDKSRNETEHRHPTFLPDGRRFIFVTTNPAHAYVGSLDSIERTPLMATESKVEYTDSGHLVFVRQGTLMAQRFDAARLTLEGEAVPVAQQIAFGAVNGRASFSVSGNGTLAYRSGASAIETELAWFDRQGRELGTVGSVADWRGVELAPNGRQAAVHKHELPGGGDLWIVDSDRRTTSRYTFDPLKHYVRGCWSKDGTNLFFSTTGESGFQILRKPSSGVGREEVLFERSGAAPVSGPTSCADDRHLLFTLIGSGTAQDVWALPLTGDRKAYPLLASPFFEMQGQLSPSGEWFAYESNESGTTQVYVQSFPVGGGKFQISSKGGLQPRWRADGRELFFITQDGVVMSAPIEADQSSFKAGAPSALFSSAARGLAGVVSTYTVYDVARDGQRFLMSRPTTQSTRLPTVVIVNWSSEL